MKTIIENIKILIDAMEADTNTLVFTKCVNIKNNPAYEELAAQLKYLEGKSTAYIKTVRTTRITRIATPFRGQ